MNTARLLELHQEMCAEAWKIMEVKNHDYAGPGDDAFSNFRACEQVGLCPSLVGLLCRMIDKLKRLITFTKTGKLKVNESAKDSCIDLINYAVIYYGITQEGD